MYYIHQAGGGGSSGGVGPIYSLHPYVQRGHVIGDYFGELFRAIKTLFFSGLRFASKELGREALRRGGRILSDIADNPQMGYKDIITKHVQDSFQNLRSKMMGGGRKRVATSRTKHPAKRRKRATTKRRKPKGKPKQRSGTKRRPLPTIKRDIFA